MRPLLVLGLLPEKVLIAHSRTLTLISYDHGHGTEVQLSTAQVETIMDIHAAPQNSNQASDASSQSVLTTTTQFVAFAFAVVVVDEEEEEILN